MLDKLVRVAVPLRLLNLIAVGCSFVGALCMVAVGLGKTLVACRVLIAETPFGDAAAVGVTAALIQAVDAFLFAMILVIFGAAVFHLFVHRIDFQMLPLGGFKQIRTISQLKKIVAELIIIILFVQFLKSAMQTAPWEWTLLVLPASILAMAVALRVLNLDPGRDEREAAERRPPPEDRAAP